MNDTIDDFYTLSHYCNNDFEIVVYVIQQHQDKRVKRSRLLKEINNVTPLTFSRNYRVEIDRALDRKLSYFEEIVSSWQD